MPPALETASSRAPNRKVNLNLSNLNDEDPFPDRILTLEAPDWSVEVGRGNSTGESSEPGPGNAWFASKVVSRSHATFSADPKSLMVTVQDNGSMHGTFLNGTQIGGEPVEIISGDVITFGTSIVRYAETYNPLKTRIAYEWDDEIGRTFNNTFTADYSDREFSIEIDDDDLEFVGESVRKSGVEVIDLSLPEHAKSSITSSPSLSPAKQPMLSSPPTSHQSWNQETQRPSPSQSTPFVSDIDKVIDEYDSEFDQLSQDEDLSVYDPEDSLPESSVADDDEEYVFNIQDIDHQPEVVDSCVKSITDTADQGEITSESGRRSDLVDDDRELGAQEIEPLAKSAEAHSDQARINQNAMGRRSSPSDAALAVSPTNEASATPYDNARPPLPSLASLVFCSEASLNERQLPSMNKLPPFRTDEWSNFALPSLPKAKTSTLPFGYSLQPPFGNRESWLDSHTVAPSSDFQSPKAKTVSDLHAVGKGDNLLKRKSDVIHSMDDWCGIDRNLRAIFHQSEAKAPDNRPSVHTQGIFGVAESIPASSPNTTIKQTTDQCSNKQHADPIPTTFSVAGETQADCEKVAEKATSADHIQERPRKRTRTSRVQNSSGGSTADNIAKYVATASVGAVLGAFGAVLGLAFLPQDYFA